MSLAGSDSSNYQGQGLGNMQYPGSQYLPGGGGGGGSTYGSVYQSLMNKIMNPPQLQQQTASTMGAMPPTSIPGMQAPPMNPPTPTNPSQASSSSGNPGYGVDEEDQDIINPYSGFGGQ